MSSPEISVEQSDALHHPLYAASVLVKRVVEKFLVKTGDLLLGEPTYNFSDPVRPDTEH